MSAAPTATAFVGIDVAKDKLDVILCQGQQFTYRVFANTADGFAALHAWLCPLGLAQLHICPEATGSYSDGVASFFHGPERWSGGRAWPSSSTSRAPRCMNGLTLIGMAMLPCASCSTGAPVAPWATMPNSRPLPGACAHGANPPQSLS